MREIITGAVCTLETYNGAVTAVATVAIAAFTIVLACVTGRQVKLSRAEFISTHRPKIIVRAFRLYFKDAYVGSKYPIEFIYLNEGETIAHIRTIRTALINNENCWNSGRDVYFNQAETLTETLRHGEQRTHRTLRDFDYDLKETNWFCVGNIEYTDDLGTVRKTGFCRRWNQRSQDWDREDNEEYEYSY